MYMLSFFDPTSLVETLKIIGYLGIAAIVFAESGLFFGFFLPGDSLLFTAGILAGDHIFNFPLLVLLIAISAIVGDNVGYWFGKYLGHKLEGRKKSLFFRPEHLKSAELFYEKYGPRAIVIARFVPIARTFVPIVAGMARMNYHRFFVYNVLGALLWGAGLTSLGFLLGKRFPNIENYLFPIACAIIAVSFLPVVIEVIKNKVKKH